MDEGTAQTGGRDRWIVAVVVLALVAAAAGAYLYLARAPRPDRNIIAPRDMKAPEPQKPQKPQKPPQKPQKPPQKPEPQEPGPEPQEPVPKPKPAPTALATAPLDPPGRAEEARKEEARKEEARKEEARKEEARRAERAAEKARNEARKAEREEARRAEKARNEARKAERRREEARKEEAMKEEAMKEEARRAEEARGEARRAEEARKEEARKAEEARKEEARKAEEARKEEAGRADKKDAPPGGTALDVRDLKKTKGGAWNTGRIDWKKSDVVTFQGQPAIKVFYGKGSGTSRHKGVGGLNFSTTPKGLPGESAMMSFQVYFEPGWHFSNGGKMTGFHIGEGSASGGRHSPNASSVRISFKEGGGAWMYVYPPSDLKQDKSELSRVTGTGIGLYREKFPPGTFKVGQWNDMKIAVRLNTIDPSGKPTAADGMAFVQVNDRSATLTGMRWRRSKNLLIEHYNFATFFGGGDPSVKDVTAYYRNFVISPWNP